MKERYGRMPAVKAGKQTEAEMLSVRINDLVNDLWVALERALSQEVPRSDQFSLTNQQHVILGQIVKESGMTPTAMAKSLGITKGAISQHLARLEQEGYFLRERSIYDKRVTVFALLPRGRAYQRMLRKYEQHLAEAYAKQLSVAELHEVIASLEKLRGVFPAAAVLRRQS